MVPVFFVYFLSSPDNREMRNSTRKIKNSILAMEAAPAAIPPNPKIAATIATIKNINAQRNIAEGFKVNNI